MLLELIREFGFQPKKTASTKGGEYHCPCPNCGGKDRFMFWPVTNDYRCRQCRISGDSIQFCREYLGLGFKEACRKIEREIPSYTTDVKHPPSSPLPPLLQWQGRGEQIINSSFNFLTNDSKRQALLKSERGLSIDSLRRNKIGWNPVKIFDLRENWGLEKCEDEGKEKKLIIPPGIMIPTYVNSILYKIKIRRSVWYMGAPFPKYQMVSGSKNHVSIFGNSSNPYVVIVEAELDAILLIQEVGDPFCVVALGGASLRPDTVTHQWLRTKKLILFSLDFDEAGKQAYAAYWKKIYPNLRAWPTPFEKSPGDAFRHGLNLKNWLEFGIQTKTQILE